MHPGGNGEARLFATEIIGHLFGYAQATNTRALALVGDAAANAYQLLFSFASSEGKEQFLHLVRTNEDMGNDYIENDFMSPTAEEIIQPTSYGTPWRFPGCPACESNLFNCS